VNVAVCARGLTNAWRLWPYFPRKSEVIPKESVTFSVRLYRQQGVHLSEASEAQLDSEASDAQLDSEDSEASEAPKAHTALLSQRSHAGMMAQSSGR
jgi:hypothetical protein